MTHIRISRYRLESADLLNARSGRRVFEGALVNIGAGYACLHSWPELGDPDLKVCLADLAGPRRTRLVRKTLVCLAADGAAREQGRSLFDGAIVPPSHATLPILSETAVASAVSLGFTHIKTKAGRNLPKELERIRHFAKQWPALKWRIDFNEAGSLNELIAIFSTWETEERAAIDFLEDPLKYHRENWADLRSATGLALANDRGLEFETGDSEVLVLKPALDDLIPGKQRRVVTSYLDHPLGQAFAAWEASRLGTAEICGLQTHRLFARTAFSEELGPAGPDFKIPTGSGLGFAAQLKELEWENYP